MKTPHISIRISIVLLCILLLGACATTPPQAVQPTATALSVASPTPFPTLVPPPLGAVPQDCPPGPTPQQVFPDVGPALGHAPLWAIGFDGPHAVIHIPTSYDTYTQYGWTWKVIWRMQGGFTSSVTLHGKNGRDDTSLWFQIGQQDPSTSPVLDPLHAVRCSASTGVCVQWG